MKGDDLEIMIAIISFLYKRSLSTDTDAIIKILHKGENNLSLFH